MNMHSPAWRRRQMQDRKTRLAQIRKAGNRSRRLERERKARLEAETAAILADPQPLLRKSRDGRVTSSERRWGGALTRGDMNR
jgi:hypothetical protein